LLLYLGKSDYNGKNKDNSKNNSNGNILSLRPSGYTPAFGREEAALRRALTQG
jgi:hypothetical protein